MVTVGLLLVIYPTLFHSMEYSFSVSFHEFTVSFFFYFSWNTRLHFISWILGFIFNFFYGICVCIPFHEFMVSFSIFMEYAFAFHLMNSRFHFSVFWIRVFSFITWNTWFLFHFIKYSVSVSFHDTRFQFHFMNAVSNSNFKFHIFLSLLNREIKPDFRIW